MTEEKCNSFTATTQYTNGYCSFKSIPDKKSYLINLNNPCLSSSVCLGGFQSTMCAVCYCSSGYHDNGNGCVPNVCTCDNGTPATGTSCYTHNANICGNCTTGYYKYKKFDSKGWCWSNDGNAYVPTSLTDFDPTSYTDEEILSACREHCRVNYTNEGTMLIDFY